MARLLRWTFNFGALLSATACIGIAWAWWHSYRGPGERFSVRLGGVPYVLRSAGGRVTALSLPQANPRSSQSLRQGIDALHNSDLQWYAQFTSHPLYAPIAGIGRIKGIGMSPPEGRPLNMPTLLGPSPWAGPAQYRPLLDALRDPERFAAVHLVLLHYTNAHGSLADEGFHVSRDWQRRRVEAMYRGLRFELPTSGAGWGDDPLAGEDLGAVYHGPAAAYDPAQIPVLYDWWYDRMAVPAASWSYRSLVCGAAFLPLLRIALRARRLAVVRRRRRLGQCLRCAYDLRGNTSERCSECGAVLEATEDPARATRPQPNTIAKGAKTDAKELSHRDH